MSMQPRYALERATVDNGHLDGLEREWRGQASEYGDEDGYGLPYLDHARRVVESGDPKYGVYVLRDDASYPGMMHINTARLPKTTGVTLRVNWILLSPRLDYEEVTDDDLAHISASVLFGALNIAKGEMRADHIKVHLNNMGDRQFAAGVAYALHGSGSPADVAVRGNWLHIDNISN